MASWNQEQQAGFNLTNPQIFIETTSSIPSSMPGTIQIMNTLTSQNVLTESNINNVNLTEEYNFYNQNYDCITPNNDYFQSNDNATSIISFNSTRQEDAKYEPALYTLPNTSIYQYQDATYKQSREYSMSHNNTDTAILTPETMTDTLLTKQRYHQFSMPSVDSIHQHNRSSSPILSEELSEPTEKAINSHQYTLKHNSMRSSEIQLPGFVHKPYKINSKKCECPNYIITEENAALGNEDIDKVLEYSGNAEKRELLLQESSKIPNIHPAIEYGDEPRLLKKYGRKRQFDDKKHYKCYMLGCEKIFKSLGDLKVHIRIHTGERPYSCNWPFCSKKFSQNNALQQHYRTHTGEQPYFCSWPSCSKKFKQSAALQYHYRTHTGEEPYSCSWPSCSKKFKQNNALQQHYRIHTGERPYSCNWPSCSKKFNQNSTLHRHYRTHKKEDR